MPGAFCRQQAYVSDKYRLQWQQLCVDRSACSVFTGHAGKQICTKCLADTLPHVCWSSLAHQPTLPCKWAQPAASESSRPPPSRLCHTTLSSAQSSASALMVCPCCTPGVKHTTTTERQPNATSTGPATRGTCLHGAPCRRPTAPGTARPSPPIRAFPRRRHRDTPHGLPAPGQGRHMPSMTGQPQLHSMVMLCIYFRDPLQKDPCPEHAVRSRGASAMVAGSTFV